MIWGFDYQPELEHRRRAAERAFEQRQLIRSVDTNSTRSRRIPALLEGLGAIMVRWGCRLQYFGQGLVPSTSKAFDPEFEKDIQAADHPSPC